MNLNQYEQQAAQRILEKFQEIRKENPNISIKDALDQSRLYVVENPPKLDKESDYSTWKLIVIGLSINALYDFLLWLIQEAPASLHTILHFSLKRDFKLTASESSISAIKENRIQNFMTLMNIYSLDSSLEPNPISVLSNSKDPQLRGVLAQIMKTMDNRK